MKLIDIARSYLSAPEGDGAGAGAGAPPAAGAKGGDEGGGGAGAGGSAGDGKGGAAGDGSAKTTDTKGGDNAAGASDQAKAKSGDASGEYKVTAPEGVKVDESRLTKFTEWAKGKGLSAQQASDALAFYVDQQKADNAELEQLNDTWGKELKADPKFGGANYDANKALAEKALVRFGGKALSDRLQALGIGNLPELVKAFAAVGAAIKEDTAAVDTAPKGGEPKPGDPKTRLSKRYDHPDSQAARTGK